VTDFVEILRVLTKHDVEFIVVGGVCAVLHGAPVATIDLDIVHSRTPENVVRLLSALQDLEARYRVPGIKDRRPGASHLLSAGHQLLVTRYGPLDLLGEIGAGRGFDGLQPHTVELHVGEDLRARVLDLDTLIMTKTEAGREKDKAMLPILRRTLAERSRSREGK
jgi:hypothetical protein